MSLTAPADKVAGQECGEHPAGFLRHLRFVEAGEGLTGWQARVLEQPLDFAGAAILHLRFGQMLQEPAIAPVLGFGPDHRAVRFTGKGGQLQRAEQDGQTFGVYALTSVSNES